MLIKNCPYCNSELSKLLEQTVCPKCGIIKKERLIALTLGVNETKAKQLLETIEPVDLNQKYLATRKGVVINSLIDGVPQMDFPSIFGVVPTTDQIVIVSQPFLLDKFEGSIFLHGWNTEWLEIFANKDIIIVYANNKNLALSSGNQLKIVAKQIRYLEDDGRDFYQLMESVNSANKSYEENENLKSNSIADQIDGYHIRNGMYSSALVVPPRVVVELVRRYLINNGWKFFWDEEEDQGFLHHNEEGTTIKLSKADRGFYSFLYENFGVCGTVPEKQALLDGLSYCKDIATKVKRRPYLELNNNELSIMSQKSVIKITKDEITQNPLDSFFLALNEEMWYQDFEYNKDVTIRESLDLFRQYAGQFFTIEEPARELVLAWFIGLFLQELSNIRPGIRVYGVASTGKSTIMELLFNLFYGWDKSGLPSYTVAGLWRRASVEPCLFFDNENVKEINEVLRNFLDGASTGRLRVIGHAGANNNIFVHHAHCPVIISGLDTFVFRDLLTRYLEITTSNAYKGSFYITKDMKRLKEMRPKILSGFLKIVQKVLQRYEEYFTRERADLYKTQLDTKHRLVDYYILMSLIGDIMVEEGFIEPDHDQRWLEYISRVSMSSQVGTSKIIDWWTSFIICLKRSSLLTNIPVKFIKNAKNQKVGIQGTQSELLLAILWTASELKRKCPYENSSEIISAMNDDLRAIEEKGWQWTIAVENDEKIYTLLWGEGEDND